MSILSKRHFHNEKAAFKYLESVLWVDGPECPHCGTVDHAYKLKGKSTRVGLWKCGSCRKQFRVTVGTVFEHLRIPLHKALQAVYLMSASKKGISAHQLHRTLEITYKTAWFLAHRIREAMRDDKLAPFGGEGKIVEADETYIGNTKGARRVDVLLSGKGWVKRNSGSAAKFKVVSLVERDGRARSVHVRSLTTNTATAILRQNVIRKTTKLMTDKANIYRAVGREFFTHESVDHGKYEWGRGIVHTNTIEGFFSIFKRGMRGVYQHCSEKHLQRYLDEFDFRYSERGASDFQRSEVALEGIKGKRLLYRQPTLPS